jgi:hypothetical protein
MNTIRFDPGAAGTQTAGLIFGGAPPPNGASATESWNGTSWTTLPATMNTARAYLSGLGTQTAALAVGGYNGPAYITTVESWTGIEAQTKTVTVS